ncbi:Epigen [Acipenser ruthenus]|uniref:Epigen n=1 Tax=Acipenser ruthenus TaxID=7906 RepID=A0A662YTJ3_ACIRT|nr:Epigen [Acipenser ruthenus]
MPRVLELLSACTEDDQSFCMNGICSYHRELNTPTCRCHKDYTGERCQHLLLDSHTEEGPEKFIAIGVGILLLIGGTMGVLYCCIKKRCDTGFTGERCAHSELVFQPMSKGYILLTVMCTVLFLTALAITFYFFYKWYVGFLF